MSEKIAKAIAELQEAVIALDVAQIDYERFATFAHPAAQISYARSKKPAMVAAEKRLAQACEALKAAGWTKPRALLPEPDEQLVDEPAADGPANAHAEAPHEPNQHLDK